MKDMEDAQFDGTRGFGVFLSSSLSSRPAATFRGASSSSDKNQPSGLGKRGSVACLDGGVVCILRSCIDRSVSIDERVLEAVSVGGERLRWAGAGLWGNVSGTGVGL